MTKQIIAIDIDDVLAATAVGLVAYSNQKWGTRLTVAAYTEDWADMWQIDHATSEQRANHLHESGIFGRFEVDNQAEPVLRHLAEHYTLVIATSRVQRVRQDTLEWLELHFSGLFQEIHMAGIFDDFGPYSLKATKAELLREIGADFLVDDQPKHCLAAAKVGIETILFGNYVWNRDLENLPRQVTRCIDWPAVREYFDVRI